MAGPLLRECWSQRFLSWVPLIRRFKGEGMETWLRPAWVEIDLDAVQHNIKKIREYVQPGVHLIAVLKADALGHGMLRVSQSLIKNGVNMIGVGDLAEALTLRQEASETIPILLLPSLQIGDYADLMVRNRIIPSISNMPEAKTFAERSSPQAPSSVFIKVDTGFMRAGVRWSDCLSLCQWIVEDGRLCLQGLYTHMASPEDEAFTKEQFDRFMMAANSLKKNRIDVPLLCVASTAVTLEYPEMHLNCVDCGRAFYGIRYLPNSRADLGLRRIFSSFKTKVIQFKHVYAGETVGYNRPWRMDNDGTLGLIPVGWAHGYPPQMANQGYALVKGRRVRVVGSVNTEHSTIDLTGLEDQVKVGEEVVLIGRQGDEKITLEEVCSLAKISIIQLTTSIGKSNTRVYLGGQ
jgi:alanine racemase